MDAPTLFSHRAIYKSSYYADIVFAIYFMGGWTGFSTYSVLVQRNNLTGKQRGLPGDVSLSKIKERNY